MIHTRMTKIIITITMMLEKRSHFKKKKNFTNCETSSVKMWYLSWFSYFLIVIFIFMIQSVCIITNFRVKVTSCFWWFYYCIFDALCSTSFTIFVLLVILVCTFIVGFWVSNAFHPRSSIFFCWWCFGTAIQSLQNAHNFDTNFFVV